MRDARRPQIAEKPDGVGIIGAMAYAQERDRGQRLIDGAHPLDAKTALIAVRRAAAICATACRYGVRLS